jgi:hypothetical protein
MRKLLTPITCVGIALTLAIGGTSTAASAHTSESPQVWSLTGAGTAECTSSGACKFAIQFPGVSGQGDITLQFTTGSTDVQVSGGVYGTVSSAGTVACTISGSGTANTAWPYATSAAITGHEDCHATAGGVVSESGGGSLGSMTATRVSGGPAPVKGAPPKPKAKAVKKEKAPSTKPLSTKTKQAVFYIAGDPVPLNNGQCTKSGTCKLVYHPRPVAGEAISGEVYLTITVTESVPPRVEISGQVDIASIQASGSSSGPSTCKFGGEGTANAPWPHSTSASGHWTSSCAYSPLGTWSLVLYPNKK